MPSLLDQYNAVAADAQAVSTAQAQADATAQAASAAAATLKAAIAKQAGDETAFEASLSEGTLYGTGDGKTFLLKLNGQVKTYPAVELSSVAVPN